MKRKPRTGPAYGGPKWTATVWNNQTIKFFELYVSGAFAQDQTSDKAFREIGELLNDYGATREKTIEVGDYIEADVLEHRGYGRWLEVTEVASDRITGKDSRGTISVPLSAVMNHWADAQPVIERIKDAVKRLRDSDLGDYFRAMLALYEESKTARAESRSPGFTRRWRLLDSGRIAVGHLRSDVYFLTNRPTIEQAKDFLRRARDEN